MTDFKHKLILYITIAALLLFIFLQRSCTSDATKQKVTIPEKSGEFKKPGTVLEIKGKKDSIVYKTIRVTTENPVNKILVERLKEALSKKDTVEIIKLYADAIEEREQTRVFDNKDVKLEVYTKTRGEILDMVPKYTIKEREEKVLVKQKETVFGAYLGAGLETTTRLDKFVPNVIFGIQNKRGDILSAHYGVTDQSVGVNYLHRFINIKK